MRLDQVLTKGTKEKNWKRKATIAIVIYLVLQASFCQFILEESLQNFNFGIMSLSMNDDWDLLREELPNYQNFHDKAQIVMYISYFLNPLTGYYFQMYMYADQQKIDIWQKQVVRHGQNSHIIVEGTVKKIAYISDGTAVIALDGTNQLLIKYPEVFVMPREGEHVKLTCVESDYRGNKGYEVREIEYP